MKKIIALSVTLEDGTVESYTGTGYTVSTSTFIPGDKKAGTKDQPVFTVAAHITPEKVGE